MIVRERFDQSDFDELGWHDSRVYGISIPDEENSFWLDIDYIFAWERRDEELKGFWVSPCKLVFYDVSNFSMNIDFRNGMLLFVASLERCNPRPSPNGNSVLWDYRIELDKGVVTFTASSFKQIVEAQPVLSDTQDIGRTTRK